MARYLIHQDFCKNDAKILNYYYFSGNYLIFITLIRAPAEGDELPM